MIVRAVEPFHIELVKILVEFSDNFTSVLSISLNECHFSYPSFKITLQQAKVIYPILVFSPKGCVLKWFIFF